jgi:acetylornithine aminotransferase
VRPDVVTLAKGLGGGLPIGACLAFGEPAGWLSAGMHGSTFGANPIAAAAALRVLDVIERDDLLSNARTQGAALRTIAQAVPQVSEVRGSGLLLGLVLRRPIAREAEAALRRRGVLVNAAQPDVLRLAPPLILSDADVAVVAAVLPDALAAAEAQS